MKSHYLLAAVTLAAAGQANAAAVALVNFSFEDTKLGDGQSIVGLGDNGWDGGLVSPTGPLNPTTADFVSVPHGDNVLFSATGLDGSGAYQGTNFQPLFTSLAANTRYTLEIDVGQAFSYDMADFAVEFAESFVSDLVYASATFAPGEVAEGTFKTLKLTFDSVEAQDTYFGIRLRTFYNPAQGSGQRITYFDNVRLDASPIVAAAIPEPATWAMMIGGFGMTGAALRRRRRMPTVAA